MQSEVICFKVKPGNTKFCKILLLLFKQKYKTECSKVVLCNVEGKLTVLQVHVAQEADSQSVIEALLHQCHRASIITSLNTWLHVLCVGIAELIFSYC